MESEGSILEAVHLGPASTLRGEFFGGEFGLGFFDRPLTPLEATGREVAALGDVEILLRTEDTEGEGGEVGVIHRGHRGLSVGLSQELIRDCVKFRASLHLLSDEGIVRASVVQMFLRHDIVERGVTTARHPVEPSTVVGIALHLRDERGVVSLLLRVVEVDAEADAGVDVSGTTRLLGETLDERVTLFRGEVNLALDVTGGELFECGLGCFHW